MNNADLQPDGKEPKVPEPAITHSPVVAVGRFNDGVGTIWTGFVFMLTGLYPLTTFILTLDKPRHMDTMGNWLLVSLLVLVGIVVLGFGVKEKGYQKESIRIFGMISFFAGNLLFLGVPVAASVMYASGIGN